jgi:thiamine-phosphate pyrophosphorylase
VTAPSPAIVVVTDRRSAEAAGHSLRQVVAAALDAGAGGVLLREKDLPAAARGHMAEHVRALTAAHGAELWVASDVGVAEAVGADGVHLASTDGWPGPAPDPPTTRPRLRVGRSCHTLAELDAARRQGADRVTYSPVFATDSKPGYGPALGLDGLAAGRRAVPGLPVVALGGVEPGRARACVEAGAAGVALMGAVMRAGDPAAVVRSVVEELAEMTEVHT